jgi:hypothetical protein
VMRLGGYLGGFVGAAVMTEMGHVEWIVSAGLLPAGVFGLFEIARAVINAGRSPVWALHIFGFAESGQVIKEVSYSPHGSSVQNW